jgi:hypothetical protein
LEKGDFERGLYLWGWWGWFFLFGEELIWGIMLGVGIVMFEVMRDVFGGILAYLS